LEKYLLRCLGCGKEYFEDSFRLSCDELHPPSLLRSFYEKRMITKKDDSLGIFKFSDWLPTLRNLDAKGAPITYRSSGFAGELGISNLFISFNGYWPERNAFMETCTFKELEAPPSVARLLDNADGRLVVASAGNTAKAFAQICSRNRVTLYLVVPESALEYLWLNEKPNSCVKLITLGSKSDYADSIQLANRLSEQEGFINEGGALNVARRDGMGTTVIDAVLTTGEIPDHYFQAVGSGTGAISAWEANLRLIQDGRYGSTKMKLHLAQNHPFTPVYDSWKANSRELTSLNDEEAKRRLNETDANVLSNRKPPYSIVGGVYDALVDTEGEMYSITNHELREAGKAFERLEGIDIDPAAAVAVAALVQAVRQQRVGKKDKILLNITGGGSMKLRADHSLHNLEPDIIVDNPDVDIGYILGKLGHKFTIKP
jgi:cysteate synthase